MRDDIEIVQEVVELAKQFPFPYHEVLDVYLSHDRNIEKTKAKLQIDCALGRMIIGGWI